MVDDAEMQHKFFPTMFVLNPADNVLCWRINGKKPNPLPETINVTALDWKVTCTDCLLYMSHEG